MNVTLEALMKILSTLATAGAFLLIAAGLFEALAEDPSAVRRKALETFSSARDQRSKSPALNEATYVAAR